MGTGFSGGGGGGRSKASASEEAKPGCAALLTAAAARVEKGLGWTAAESLWVAATLARVVEEAPERRILVNPASTKT